MRFLLWLPPVARLLAQCEEWKQKTFAAEQESAHLRAQLLSMQGDYTHSCKLVANAFAVDAGRTPPYADVATPGEKKPLPPPTAARNIPQLGREAVEESTYALIEQYFQQNEN